MHRYGVFFVAAVVSVVPCVSADVLTFDDLPRLVNVGEGYAAHGVHFTLTDFGVLGGLAEGDPGNWDLHGTNGSAFMGFNGHAAGTTAGNLPQYYAMTITFDFPVTGFSMDASRSLGTFGGERLDVQFWLGGAQVGGGSYLFGPINTWLTASFAGPLDRVTFTSAGGEVPTYGVDNIQFTVPSGGAASVLGVMCLGALRRRRC